MKLPFLPSVVPPHVFCLLADGVTWANVRREPVPGFVDSRHFAYPANTLGAGGSGTPLFSREAIADAVEAARKLSEGRLSRASVVFPDSWARILPIDFDTLPESEEAVHEMVLWKLKKLLPGISEDLDVVYDEMPKAGEGEIRLLVAAAPSETLRSIEQSFESVGVRVGALAPASLVLFEGFSPVLGPLAGGDYALLHRSPGSFVLVIARDGGGGPPVFFRQRPEEEVEEDQEQEVRLSLSYYFEKLHGEGLSAVFVHDAAPGRELASVSAFPVKAMPLSGRLFSADRGFDERIAARPELLSAFAAARAGG